jgi:adenine-specific DNA-methyltransferase
VATRPSRQILTSTPPVSYGDPTSENMLVRGDNLAVLEGLRASHHGKFRCIYADPPFNTGRKFAEYNDAWGPDQWRKMMGVRLEAMRLLLAEDGAIFVEIDDTQLGDLLALMDTAFGRDNRVSTVTVVRSASTGHKAINRGPTNVSDFLLVYAKNRSAWRAHPQWKRRDGRDAAYSTYLVNRDEPPAGWRFEPLAKAVARSLGHAGRSAATRDLGADGFERAVMRFSLENATSVVRFAQPRYDAVSLEARRWIDRSTKHPETVIVLERGELRPLVLRAGNRILFLSDKVRIENGERVLVEPLTNVWNDVPFQGISREGGVTFVRNKKPERLLERVLRLSTSPGDWVLDPFLGSGTTAAVAHKMERRYVGVELGKTFADLCVPRLKRVVDGEDATGVTRSSGWSGGGGFGIYT